MLKQIHKIYIYAHFMFLLYINRLVHALCSLPSKIYVLLGILRVKHFLKRNKHCYIILVQDFARLLYRFFHNIILFLFKNSARWVWHPQPFSSRGSNRLPGRENENPPNPGCDSEGDSFTHRWKFSTCRVRTPDLRVPPEYPDQLSFGKLFLFEMACI